MNIKIPQLLALFTTLSATIGLPEIATKWVHTHPSIYLVIVGAAVVLHALLPSLFAAPSEGEKASAGLGKLGAVLLVLALGLGATSTMAAQASSAAPLPDAPPTNIYTVGLSYNNGATPSLAGTVSYLRLISASSGTYGFTVMDILPESLQPAIVTTNIGVGVAQRVLTVNGINFMVPVSTGLTVTGTNQGWNWTGGGLADYVVKRGGVATQYHIQPNIRFVKSTVNNGAGYQLILGMNFGIGQ